MTQLGYEGLVSWAKATSPAFRLKDAKRITGKCCQPTAGQEHQASFQLSPWPPWPRRDTGILGLVHTCRTEGPVAWASLEPPPVSLWEVPLRSQVTDEETGCRSEVNQAGVNLTSLLSCRPSTPIFSR